MVKKLFARIGRIVALRDGISALVFVSGILFYLVPESAAAPSPFVIEAEDFNYDSGQHVSSASVMPYLGGGYNTRSAVAEVDYHQPGNEPSSDEYRVGENPNVPMTQNGDMQRPGWTMTTNYRIGWTDVGDWYNYTRNFPAGTYKVSIALSHDSTAEGMLKGSLQRVASAATTVNQTVQQLGVFNAPGSGGWGVNNLVPLKDAAGRTVELPLNGLTTLRFTAESGDIDYLVFEPLLPPQITQQPASLTVAESQPASFSVTVADASAVTFQWQSNQVNIVGATNSTLNIPFAPISADGAKFRCIASNSQGNVASVEATLTVTSETIPPTIVSAYNVGTASVVIRFSEPLNAPSAGSSGNYRLSGGTVSAAALNPDSMSVTLTTSALTYRTSYTVTVSGVRDASGAGNMIAPNSTVTFIAQDFIAADIGGTGQTIARETGYNVTAQGSAIGGTADAFHFGYQQKTGNFDIRARIAGIKITDAFMRAGLMARESLAPESRFVGAFASSPQLGAFFEARPVAGAKATNAIPPSGFPANYPSMWLRLQRSGNLFTSFASLEGEKWTVLGANTIALPSTVYFGLAVSSGTTNTTTNVEFRDLEDVNSGSVGPLQYSRERLGPSSRRTGMAISEIMYHPAPRGDARNLQFVELYNGGPVFEDLSGMRLSGAIEFVFPEGARLEAGAFAVVAKVPGDVQAIYGISDVYGPYAGGLQNDSGVVRLSDERGHTLLEAEYSDGRDWPAAADGAGSSLVLARPSYGERDARAWDASTFIGGSPGTTDPVIPTPESNVTINELLAHTDLPQVDFIELYNHSNDEVDLSGFWLSDEAGTNKFRLPNGSRIPARGFLSFDQTTLGFALSAEGEAVFLVSSNGTRILDAVKFPAQENGVSYGRWPDGASTFWRLETVTRGAANSRWKVSAIVINEVMYAPISGNSDDEYVELFNNGSQAVALGGWKLSGGIDFKFPGGASVPAGGYVVVGKNAARLRANYTQLNANNAFGDYSGSLGNGGERIALEMPDDVISTNRFEQIVTNKIYIAVSEVKYRDGGRWPEWADAGGSSLELIDPRADTLQADNWRESDETGKAAWSTVEWTGVLDNGHSSYTPANQLQITLQGAGECLVDNVEVLKAGVNYVVANADFENGTTGWVFQGNHAQSTVDTGNAFQGTRALHVRAPGRGDTGVNRIRTALTANSTAGLTLVSGNTVTIRAKVRWLKGWPEILLRLRGNWLECAGRMTLPVNLGTPGLANSRKLQNAGPAIYEVRHWPANPAAGQAALVTARVSDPDAPTTLTLRYRIDPATTVQALEMRDDGTLGDAVSGDGLYTATISGRGAGTLVAFRVEASDRSGATTMYPNDAPTRECLIRWGDPVRFGSFASYFMWATSKTVTDWNNSDDKNNLYRDVTFVYNGERVVYNAGVKDKGSPFHGGGGDALLVMPSDEQVLGATDFAICSTGNGGNESTSQREQMIFWIGRKIGANYLNRRPVNFIYNGSSWRGRNIMEDAEEPNGDYARASVPEADGGDLYKIEDWFEFDDAASGFSNTDASLQERTTGGAYKTAAYRWMFRKRAVEDSANNYTNLFNLVAAVNNAGGGDYIARVENAVDVRGWMAVFALQRIGGNWDSFGFNRGKNSYLFKGEGAKWALFPWDIDFVLGEGGNGANDALWGTFDPAVTRMYNTLQFRRYLWQAYQEAISGPLLTQNYRPQIDARYRALVENAINGVSAPGGIASYIDGRRTKIQTDLNAANTSALSITSNNGNDFTTTSPTLTLTGRAPFSVYAIEINGVAYPVRWSTVTDWSIQVPLSAAQTTLQVVGRDRIGNVIPGMTDSIRIAYTGQILKPEDNLVINEIMYNPAVGGSSFVEIYNRSPQSSFDISGYRLDGVGYTFPDGTVIAPNSYVVIAQSLAGFAAAYGPNIVPVGEFPGSLDNGGERLKLVKPGATPETDLLIDEVRYDDDLPWPFAADGFGSSLQLIDAGQDNWPVANWVAAPTNAVNRATPGGLNAGTQGLALFPKLYLNEVLPNNIAGFADRFGEKEPWVELVNGGTSAVDLSALYLTDTYTNLAKWRFPAGATLGAGQYLVVFADGEAPESNNAEFHTSFRLNPTNGSIALVRMHGTQPVVLDYIDYASISAGRSYGSYPDAQPQRRRLFDFATPGVANNPASSPIRVFINEWLAGNNRIEDPVDHDFDDWIELYNAGTNSVDLGGYFLTDTLTNATKFTIPNGKVIPAGGYLVVWADEETAQNATSSDIHANFKLALAGEQIGLFAPDGSVIDSLTFGPQTDDVSEGRATDGEAPPFVTFASPSPRAPNVVASGNQPPVLTAIGNKSVVEGVLLTFQARATDPNAGQTVTYSLINEPPGAAIDSGTGVLTWIPSEQQGPGSFTFTIRAVDNGTPPRSASETIRVDVSEANRPPTLADIPDVTINEGSPLVLELQATDPDVPTNILAFSLEAGAPAGATISPTTGQINWIPSEAQGPGDYVIGIRVTDNGSPALSAVKTVRVRVNEANNAPVLDPIFPASIDEGETFSVTARAVDPDSPPSAIAYTLAGNVPAGAVIDSTTGVLRWPTAEIHGPSTNVITIRATELNGDGLSDTREFTVIVREVNQAPLLSTIADRFVADGGALEIQVQARDNDLPSQTLSYALLPGSPSGMTIDGTSGLIRWNVPIDQQAATNAVSVKVTDDGPGALAATNTFRVIVQPAVRVVINEIMHSPIVANGQYVELHNTSASTAWNLGGWRLEARNLSFTFPPNASIPPGGFVLVVQNNAAFASTYGAGKPVGGQWTGTLAIGGDTLRLIRPTSGGDMVIDAVTFRSGAPWPAASNGSALQLIDPFQDNNRVANWQAVSNFAGPTNLVVMTNVWRYNQAGLELGSSWRGLDYDDVAWPSGPALLYVENSPLPAPKNTLLTLGRTTYYFRTKFTLNAKPEGAQLALNMVLDDGAVFYLNGVEVYRTGMGSGTATYNTFSTRTVGDAALEGPVTIPGDVLLAGENVLAVEVHQANATSSDIVFGCVLDLVGGQVAGSTPGSVNSIKSSIPAFEPLFVNEVLPLNSKGVADSAGEREPWVEIYNAGINPVSLQDFYLTDDYQDLHRWAFPAGASIAPGEFKIVWLDGEANETLGPEWHASFRAAANGSVALIRTQNGQAAVLDYLNYSGSVADISFGDLPDGQVQEQSQVAPTPGARNTAAQVNHAPVIEPVGSTSVNEGAPLAFPIQASDPDAGQILSYRLENSPEGASLNATSGAFRWTPTEAQGPGTNLIRVIVTDNGVPVMSATNEFVVRVLEVNAAPTVDPIPNQSATTGTLLTYSVVARDLDLPLQRLLYSLTQGSALGASVNGAGLFSWTPSAAQAGTTNRFEITVSDDVPGSLSAMVSFFVTVPRATLVQPTVAARLASNKCVLSWNTEVGRKYRVQSADSVTATSWKLLQEVTAVGTTSTLNDAIAGTRFYRIEVVP